MTKAAYEALMTEVHAIEEATGLFLADENEDAQNALDAGHRYGSKAFWNLCFASACQAAGFRAHDAGHNINALIGRVIY